MKPMQPQVDYEAEVHVALFRSEETLTSTERRLYQFGIDHLRVALPPGEYLLADPRLRKHARAAILGSVIGAVLGAAVGAGLAGWLFGAAVHIITWLAVAGAGGGAVIGGLVGVQFSAEYDDDVARTVTIAPGETAIALVTHTPQAARGHGQVRTILRRGGAVAFLDVPSFEAERRQSSGDERWTGSPDRPRPPVRAARDQT
jgi:hypothetical protein